MMHEITVARAREMCNVCSNRQCWLQRRAQEFGVKEARRASTWQMREQEVRRGGWEIQLHIFIVMRLAWSFCCKDAKVQENRRSARRWGAGDNGIIKLEGLKSISRSGMTDPCHMAGALNNSDLCWEYLLLLLWMFLCVILNTLFLAKDLMTNQG